ncbi:MAG: sugar ABC transporter ATP-binding protein [Verrucomicrobia bacterium]|nr:sugar ABC transporter ATP-binding protein [Verrucomicrobiota bacterium]MCG2679727.1 sugar ABC transporter ATP-binding protein [Kiritimatiellia bacterium]MBU4247565.1 sugar ABC transporter ATP-binding protein [Verrucomicrobiota bacterium]MBU4290715.1 sugar ABC transporter ATP-binding protein [Verrucomicrobiota bacterium]MBU4428799.1 sugar ABC transporter ATP-binding protein [Verrucomicrobiota bacterium]
MSTPSQSTAPEPPLLDMRNIRKQFGATLALDGVDLTVPAGEVHAVVGENGAGKSTLMKILAGVIPPDQGTIKIAGRDFRPTHPLDARRAGIAMIYQELSLAPHLSVEENIMLGMEQTRWGLLRRAAMRERVQDALALLNQAPLNPNTRVGNLPPAIQQLVEIARALAIGCRVLVLDEPTSSLTREDAEKLFEVIRRLKAQKHAIIYISHFLEEVQQIADRCSVLRDGRTVGSGLVAATSVNEIIRLMVGKKIEQLYPRSPRTPGDIILNVRDLAGPQKPESAGLILRRGEVLGIAGLVGAGRTEFLRAMFGLDAIRQGAITLGLYSGPASPSRRWSQGMGLVSEDRKNEGLALALSIADNMTLSKLEDLGPGGLILPSRQTAVVRTQIDKLGIHCRGPAQKVGDLSGGNQQKVALARLLYHDVDILLLDEPTRGIDVASKAQIYGLIDKLVSQGQPPKAILMVSSYLPELLGVCDRVAVMCRGRLGPAHAVGATDEHRLMLEAATGEAAA